MAKEPAKIFDVEFFPAEPSAAVASRTSRFVSESGGRYADSYDCFECKPYTETLLVRLYTRRTVPSRLPSWWLCNGTLFVELPGTVEKLESYADGLGLQLTDKTISAFAALVSKSLTEWDGLDLAEPKGQEAQIKAEVAVSSMIDVKRSDEGTWKVTSYHLSDFEDRFARVRYEIQDAGVVDPASVEVDLLGGKAINQVLIM